MRYLKKAWQDRRPGWTRRVRWYEGLSVRLQFEDTDGKAHQVYERHADAKKDYDAFARGELTVVQILRRRN